MIITKFTSSKEIIENVFRTTGQQTDITPDDVMYWMHECLELVGYPLQYVPKVIGSKQDPAYHFTDYKVPLPCDFYKLIPAGISVNGNPVRWSNSAFHYLLDGDCCDLEHLNSQSMDMFVDNWGNEFSPQAGRNPMQPDKYWDVTFQINDGEIVFNVKEGDVCLAYYSLPVDNDGFILIPDDAKYKRAVTNYLVWKIDHILWRQNIISDKVYQESKYEANWSMASVAAHAKLPDVEQTQSILNSVIRLLPHRNEYQHFFKGLGFPEQRPFR